MVHAPAGHLHDDLLDRPDSIRRAMVLRIDAVGRAHRARLVELGGIGVDGDDPPGLRLHRALDHRQPQRRSEEHTSELQSLMRISYAVFCLKKKTPKLNKTQK